MLMDIANRCGGMVVGTGDLSELALGWATYNGDHMSMYGVNASAVSYTHLDVYKRQQPVQLLCPRAETSCIVHHPEDFPAMHTLLAELDFAVEMCIRDRYSRHSTLPAPPPAVYNGRPIS